MDITLILSDDTELQIECFTYDPYEICDEILGSKELKRKQIKHVKLTEKYVKNVDYEDNGDEDRPRPRGAHGPSTEELQDLINKYKPFVNTKISIKDITPYTFTIEVEGNIFESLGTLRLFRLTDDFIRYRNYLNTDIAIVNFLLKGTEGRNIDISRSLILRFLSERHCNLNPNNIYEILRHDIAKKDLSDYVSIVFYKVHGFKIDDAKELEEKLDKLSMKAILGSKIKELDDEIARRLNQDRPRNDVRMEVLD
jgi:hypothetical protein